MLAGRETHGPWLRLGMEVEYARALADARAAESALAATRARVAEAGRRGAAADAALTGWLAKARLVLMLALGGEWSERWLAAGFAHRGTNVPKRIGARMELGRGVTEFLQAHPEYAVPFAEVTAAAGRAVHGEITAAAREMRDADCEAGECKHIRDAAEKHLRRRMRLTVLLLSARLASNDPRWRAFGLHAPTRGLPARRRHRRASAKAGASVTVIATVAAEPLLDAA